LPALPPGLTSVEIAGGGAHTIARRSDGWVVAWGRNLEGQCNVPPLPPGLTYVRLAAGGYHALARLGSSSTYSTFSTGCSGGRPATRIVPLDTPRIGNTLQLRLFDLPSDAAFLFAGLSNTTSALGPLPLSLTSVGMPGCTLYVSTDFTTLLVGANQQATYNLPIPNVSGLVGAVFFQQALVIDSGAGNSLGAVMSDAAAAVVGG